MAKRKTSRSRSKSTQRMSSRSSNNALHRTLNFVAWLTGVIVSLSVAFGMIDGTLSLPIWLGGATLALFAGWVVVITTILGVVLAIASYLS